MQDNKHLTAPKGERATGRDRNDDLWGFAQASDKRETMPRGGYVFGRSNAALRPVVPKGK